MTASAGLIRSLCMTRYPLRENHLAGPLIIAHRGLASTSPENSISGFRDALAAGADMIELDIHNTKDGSFVVSHDGRASGSSLRFCDMALAQIREVFPDRDALPELVDAISHLRQCPLDVEIKTCRNTDSFVHYLERSPLPFGSVISSFDVSILNALHDARVTSPTILILSISRRRGILHNLRTLRYLLFPRTLPRWLAGCAVNERLLTRTIVRRYRKLQLVTYAWTVDDPRRGAELAAWGVTGIITNRVDVFTSARSPG